MNQETRVRMRTHHENVSKPPEMTQSDLKITKPMLFIPERVKNNFISLQRIGSVFIRY